MIFQDISKAFGFSLEQCCPQEYKMKDIKAYQITKEIMSLANKNAILNPCPSFYRGEEVSGDAVDSDYFVGYEFKKSLLTVQKAIIIYCMTH